MVKSVRNRRNKKPYIHVALSKNGTAFRAECLAEVLTRRAMHKFVNGERLQVEIYLYPPDRRKRDVDNYTKVLFDSLTHAGLWGDDEQVDQLTITRCAIHPPEGQTLVAIYPAQGQILQIADDAMLSDQ